MKKETVPLFLQLIKEGYLFDGDICPLIKEGKCYLLHGHIEWAVRTMS